MLINFAVENWMCFRERAEFSMLASRERQHNERVPYVKNYKEKVLPISAIYGGNASGKSAFCKAITFAKYMITEGPRKPDNRILVNPFRLDQNSHKKASHFEITFLVEEDSKEIMYEFAFSATSKEIITESLHKIGKKAHKEPLYKREKGKISFGNEYNKNKDKDEYKNLIAYSKGTRANQLFLNNAVSQGHKSFKPVHDWFDTTLMIAEPNSNFRGFGELLDKKSPLYKDMQTTLSQMDTGIAKFGFEEVPFKNIGFPQELINEMEEEITGNAISIAMKDNVIIVVYRKKDELHAKELMTFHKKIDSNDEKFNLDEESDGTVRLMHLLPGFLILAKMSKKVFVIDELDRSMHSHLTEKLIEFYLRFCSPDSRSQLIFTTHDTKLMTQANFRRDEIWLTERDSQNKSEIYSLSDFKGIRFDKNIRNSYLLGTLGGTPDIDIDLDIGESS